MGESPPFRRAALITVIRRRLLGRAMTKLKPNTCCGPGSAWGPYFSRTLGTGPRAQRGYQALFALIDFFPLLSPAAHQALSSLAPRRTVHHLKASVTSILHMYQAQSVIRTDVTAGLACWNLRSQVR